MKRLTILSVAMTLLVSGVLAQSPEPAKQAKPARDHAWLKQLLGEWEAQYKMYFQPGQPPAESTGTDNVRALGELWVIAETKTTMMGAPYSGVMTLGYDPQKERFQGTWVDSFGGQLWIYKGTLNDAGDTLTLETEGPSLQSPGKTALYKEVIKFTGEGSRTFTSSYETQDGKWVTIVEAEYRRKKS